MTETIGGLGVGHWTNPEARTGCTVIVFPDGTVASGEVRGGAPATREFALLDPSRIVASVDAVVLSGGSAFGLASADGVMAELEHAGRGFPTRFGRVPIVVGMSLYDLGVGDPAIRPGRDEGRSACREALASIGRPITGGRIGAGCGATVGKWGGSAIDGGLGVATVVESVAESIVDEAGDTRLVVMALIAVNAFGFIDDGSLGDEPGRPQPPAFEPAAGQIEGAVETSADRSNTTIGVIVTNARISKGDCHLLAQSGHDGLARSLLPAHTAVDGDALVAAATGELEVDVDVMWLRALAQAAVVRAVRSAGATSL
ncbi:MAG: P1 family peptidase [Acidimicrobiia bacterium]|nr:P1 family peptidase [Acidimicrobiia bacterium]